MPGRCSIPGPGHIGASPRLALGGCSHASTSMSLWRPHAFITVMANQAKFAGGAWLYPTANGGLGVQGLGGLEQ